MAKSTRTLPRWIDVKAIQPKFDTPVLVCEAGKPDSVQICRLIEKRENLGGVSFDFHEGTRGFDTCYITVTHWQPLPPAYEAL